MENPLQKFLLLLAGDGAKREFAKGVRKLVSAAARSVDIVSDVRAIAAIESAHNAVCDKFVPVDKIDAGGSFDVCDLRYWLHFAEKSGVAHIPAKEILSLSTEEISKLSGPVNLENLPGMKRIRSKMADAVLKNLEFAKDIESSGKIALPSDLDRNTIVEKTFAAMDEIPDGWMVRHVRVGPSTAKTLIGTGTSPISDMAPSVSLPEIKPGFAIGPGWLQIGNRRAVDVLDDRIMRAGIVPGPEGAQVFVARPWVACSRYLEAQDPHREGSPLAGVGVWPAEWRAFVKNGRVEGVAAYYGWAHAGEPEDARQALLVRDLAQKIVDAAVASNAVGANIELEMYRTSGKEVKNPMIKSALEEFSADGFHCTLDFIETENGPVFLEGGPPFTPIGGSHPCAFAGIKEIAGVALKVMPGVSMADPRSWRETDKTGSIVSWEEAAERRSLCASISASVTKPTSAHAEIISSSSV
jgi:hypothetical protein